jgi:proline dehydrogenase
MEIKKTALDFSNTQIAFSNKSDAQLKKTAWLFRMMNNPRLVKIGNVVALKAVALRLPFAETAIKNTIFPQFCGGTTLLNSTPTIDNLGSHNTKSMLDFGVEGKETDEEFNKTMVENIRAIDFASKSKTIPFVVIKITGLTRFDLLAKIQSNAPLTFDEQNEYFNSSKRVDAICHAARDKGICILIDAEESWIQDAIDRVANMMMGRYNKDKVVVYNTFQMYRHDRLSFLKESYNLAREKDYILGAKIVRGAYMEKERTRAEDMGYATPINPDKVATDKQFNEALMFCASNFEHVACINATHNVQSTVLLAELMEEMGIARDHSHFYFSQLLGMSDNITFNLSAAGYNVAKYIVYGSVRDVTPFLIRRAQENTSITGDMSREYSLIQKEMKRRGL